MSKVEELQATAKQAVADAKQAQERAAQAVKEAEEADRKEQWEKQKVEYARQAKEAVDNTTLPKWLVSWIQYKAYEDGHSAGQSEVDMLTFSMIHEAEDFQKKNESS
jgi:hypothetical protein